MIGVAGVKLILEGILFEETPLLISDIVICLIIFYCINSSLIWFNKS